MKKLFILSLIIASVISADNDVLTVYPHKEIGKVKEELFGANVSFGYPLLLSIANGYKAVLDSGYIERMNWLEGLWNPDSGAPDPTYLQFCRDAGINVLRFGVDFGMLMGPKYSAYDTGYGDIFGDGYVFDWRGWIGPPNSERTAENGWDTIFQAAESVTVCIPGPSCTTVYVVDTIFVWYEATSEKTLYIPSRFPFDFKFAYLFEICESLDCAAALVIFAVADTFDNDVTTDSLYSPHIFLYTHDILEYCMAESGPYAAFRDSFDHDGPFPIKKWFWTLGNDWTNCYWYDIKDEIAGWRKIPGYVEFIDTIYNPIDSTIIEDIHYNRFSDSPYKPDFLEEWIDTHVDWRVMKEMRNAAMGASFYRRVNSFNMALDSLGLRDSVRVGHWIGYLSTYSSSYIEDDDTLIIHGYPDYYFAKYGADSSGLIDFAGYFNYSTYPFSEYLQVEGDSVADFLIDSCGSVDYKESYPLAISIWANGHRNNVLDLDSIARLYESYYTDTFSSEPMPFAFTEWNIWGFHNSMVGGFAASNCFDWMIKSEISGDADFPPIEFAIHHTLNGHFFGMSYGCPDDYDEWCDEDGIMVLPVGQLHKFYENNFGEGLIEGELELNDSILFEGFYLTIDTSDCSDTTFLPPDSGLPIWIWNAANDDSGKIKLIITNRFLGDTSTNTKSLDINISNYLPVIYEDSVQVTTFEVDSSLWDDYLDFLACDENDTFSAPAVFAGTYPGYGPDIDEFDFHLHLHILDSLVWCGDTSGINACVDTIKAHGALGQYVYPFMDTTYKVAFSSDTLFSLTLPRHSISAVEIYPHWQISLKEGWNLISLPVEFNNDDTTLGDVFDTSSLRAGEVWGWNENTYIHYEITDSAANDWIGKGFWFIAKLDTAFSIPDAVIDTVYACTTTVRNGWNLLGSVHCVRNVDKLIYNEYHGKLTKNVGYSATQDTFFMTDFILPYFGYFALFDVADWFTAGDTMSVRLECSSDSATAGDEHDFNKSWLMELLIRRIVDSDTIDFFAVIGVSDTARDCYVKDEDLPISPDGPWFDPDSDFSAYCWVTAPVKTKLSESIISDLSGAFNFSDLIITGADSVDVSIENIDSIPSNIELQLIADDRGWNMLDDTTATVAPGDFATRSLDTDDIADGIWLYTGQGSGSYWLRDNVVMPNVYEKPYQDIGNEMMILTTPAPQNNDTFYLKLDADEFGYQYIERVYLMPFDYDTSLVPFRYGEHIRTLNPDSAYDFTYIIDDNSDTITDILADDDGWTYVSDDSGSMTFYIDTLLFSNDTLYFVCPPPAAPLPEDNVPSYAIVEYRGAQGGWVEAQKIYGRAGIFNEYAIVFYPDVVTSMVRLTWNRGIRLDKVWVIEISNTNACTQRYPLDLKTASHSMFGDISQGMKKLGNYVSIGKDESIEIKFTPLILPSIPDGMNRDFVFIITDEDETDTDSLWAEVNITTDTILVNRRGTATAIESAFVCIDDGDTGV